MILAGAVLWLNGCAALGWYGQAVRGQLEILVKREDIAEIIDDPAAPPDLRERLSTALEIRDFASRELHLPDNRSYTLYADLERDAAVWNVVAAPRYSLDPRTWCYPVAGCLAYRGYFRREHAERLAAKLSFEGYDTLVAPVPAYSTLGRFADPVLNTMLRWNDARLAALIFHELAHQRVFVRGDTAFNESYATFVEREGVRRWLASLGDEQALEDWIRSVRLRQSFNELLLDARERLAELYATDLPETEMELRKQAEFDRLYDAYSGFAETHRSARFENWMNQDLNNAHLALVATYEDGTRAFARLFEELDGDMEEFHRRVESLAGKSRDRRAAFLDGGD